MLEGAVMEYAKWFIGLVSLVFIVILVVFMFRLNEVNSFQQEVNYQIERHGGLTEDAMLALNEQAKQSYGGCLAKTDEENAPCLFEADAGGESSGFFVREFETRPDGSSVYIDRDNNEQARYGTKINYVLTRQIGTGSMMAMFKPALTGASSSRVRGTGD